MYGQTVYYREYGEPHEVLTVERREVAEPGPGEIVAEMACRPINPSDWIPIRGAYRHRTSLPGIPGYEGVGTVVRVGPDVPNDMLGKRVLPLRGEGTWQQYVKTSASLAVPVPDFVPDSDACRLYINPLTAWVVCKMLFGNGRPDGYCLLVNACSSAIGRIFAQWAAVFGYRLIAVVRKAEHRQELLRLGAWQVVDSSQTDLREAVLELTHGRGADAAIDSIGGSSGYRLAQAVRRCGLFLSIGLLSGIQVDWQRIATKLGVEGKLFHLRHWVASASDDAWQGAFTQLYALYRQKQLDLGKPAASFILSEAAKAVRAAEQSGGKVLLV